MMDRNEAVARESSPVPATSPTDLASFVCATDKETKATVHIRDYTAEHEADIPATVWEAALATSAAVTFFDACALGNRVFLDGGTGANNPVREVEEEATIIWTEDKGQLERLVKCFISIGTGHPGIDAVKDSVYGFLTKTLVQLATDTEKVAKQFVGTWAGHFEKKRYYRFNVEQGMQGMELHEYKKIGTMEATTELYLNHAERKQRVRDCTQNLALKESVYLYDFA